MLEITKNKMWKYAQVSLLSPTDNRNLNNNIKSPYSIIVMNKNTPYI